MVPVNGALFPTPPPVFETPLRQSRLVKHQLNCSGQRSTMQNSTNTDTAAASEEPFEPSSASSASLSAPLPRAHSHALPAGGAELSGRHPPAPPGALRLHIPFPVKFNVSTSKTKWHAPAAAPLGLRGVPDEVRLMLPRAEDTDSPACTAPSLCSSPDGPGLA